jgi:hypothetical protein
VILESIHSFTRNQAETINKFLCLDGWPNGTNKSDYKNIHLLLYKLQVG